MYARIIVDIAHSDVDRLFTYLVPDDICICEGTRVLVPFGRGDRPTEGFAVELSETCDLPGRVKPVLRALDPYPALLPDQLRLARWMQGAYNCLLVEALRLMIPPQLRGGHVRERFERLLSPAPSLTFDACAALLTAKNGAVRAPKQLEALRLVYERGPTSVSDLNALLPGAASAVNALLRRGLLTQTGTVSFRTPRAGLHEADKRPTLTPAQEEAAAAVAESIGSGGTFLLHGVTGSGKTEVYIRCIEACLARGLQAIVLVPEIALTPQAVGRFQARFGERVAVLHSRLSAGERYDEWRRIRLARAHVAVGARSCIFAPFERLGLIVIDEEHEPSYQSEQNPRYHALDAALRRAGDTNAALVLGSATPQLLTYYRALSGRYRLLTLPERVNKRPMPKVEIVDMREEFLAGNNGIFSRRLVHLIDDCLSDGKQAMLFLNRRGYSTFVSCRACGYVAQCRNCDISLTYHKGQDRLRCHFCGASEPLPARCPACGKPFIKYFGVGTEQVEEQLRSRFPEAKTLRMDADTVSGRDAMQDMLEAFAAGRAQVLIGTQMIAKGHDFPNVTLVGVIAADATLCIPDYRSSERTFQLLTQVAGRAGRDDSPGRVVVQTYSPAHPAVRYAKTHDYDGFYRYEITERRKALFPPFSLFVRLLFSDRDEARLYAAGERYAEALGEALKESLGEAGARDLLLMLPSPAPVKRRKGHYRYQILIKLLRTARTAETIRTVYDFIAANRSELFAAVEVNPQDMF